MKLQLGADGQVDIVQRAYGAPDKHWALDTAQALRQSVEAHSHEWAAARSRHYVLDAPAAERSPEHMQALEQLSDHDRALFDRIREQVPAHIGDEYVLHAMVEGREQAGLTGPERLGAVQLRGDRLLVGNSSVAAFSVEIDLTQQPPSMQASLERNIALNELQVLDAWQRTQNGQQESAMQMA